MKIKARLTLNTYISMGAIILMMISFAWSFQEAYRAEQNLQLTDDLRKAAFERISLRDDYLLHREERAIAQWYAKSKTFRELLELAHKRFDNKEDKALLLNVQKEFDGTFSLFSEVLEHHNSEERTAKKGFAFDEAELRLLGQVLLRSYTLIDNIEMLHESAQRASIAARNKGVVFIILFIIAGVIAMVINSAFVSRIVMKRLSAIDKGIGIIGSGNLDYRIDATGDDELSALARASNEMVAKLKDSYTSVENLKREIIERKQAEDTLRQQSEFLEILLETIPNPIFYKDVDGKYTGCNRAFEEFLGRSREEIIGKTVYDMGPKEIAGKYSQNDKELFDHPCEQHYEWQVQRKDGEIREVIFDKAAIVDRDGRIEGLIGVISDITERKQAEKALRESQARLDLALQSANMGVWHWDLVEKKRYFDEQVCRLLGLDAASFTGVEEEFFRVVHPDDREKIRAALARTIDQDMPYQPEYRVIWPDGSIHHVTARGRLIRDDHGMPLRLNGIIWDITEQKWAEEERKQLEQGLQQAQKAESLGRMAGAVAHHFNNLLGVLIANLELATIHLPPGSKPRANVAGAIEASKRAADISRLMLTYLGQTIGTRAPVELADVCREALPLLAVSLPEKVQLRTELPDRGPTIRANAVQMRQILTNLVENAGEAIGDGEGDVTVGIIVMPAADIRASRFYPPEWEPKEKSYACLSVSDTGAGMDPETLEKVFDPFFSTKFTGRGLGLAVVQGVMKAHEGAVTVESDPDRGTVFRVFLPLSAEEEKLPRRAEPVDSVPF